MTDEQLRRTESRKARAAFEERVDAALRSLLACRESVDASVTDAARVVMSDALKREARIAERRTARRVGLR